VAAIVRDHDGVGSIVLILNVGKIQRQGRTATGLRDRVRADPGIEDDWISVTKPLGGKRSFALGYKRQAVWLTEGRCICRRRWLNHPDAHRNLHLLADKRAAAADYFKTVKA